MDLRGFEFYTGTAIPVSGAGVVVREASTTYPNPNPIIGTTTTDGNGMWSVTGLPDGPKDVDVTIDNLVWRHKGMSKLSLSSLYVQGSPSTPINWLPNGGQDQWPNGNGPFTITTVAAQHNYPFYTVTGPGSSTTMQREAAFVSNASVASARINHAQASGAAFHEVRLGAEIARQFQGKEIVVSVSIRQSVAAGLYLYVYDGLTTQSSLRSSTVGSFVTLTKTVTVPNNATQLTVGVGIDTTGTYYIDNMMLQLGADATAFVTHPDDSDGIAWGDSYTVRGLVPYFPSTALSATTGTFSGAVSMTALTATTGTFSGAIASSGATFGGANIGSINNVGAATGTFSGAVSMTALTATTGTFSGAVSMTALTATSVNAGSGAIQTTGNVTWGTGSNRTNSAPADMNTATASGFYSASAATLNLPSASDYHVLVIRNPSANIHWQIAQNYYSSALTYMRIHDGTTWLAWQLIFTAASQPYVAKFNSGTYVGDNVTGRQITVGFQPKIVVIRRSGGALAWYIVEGLSGTMRSILFDTLNGPGGDEVMDFAIQMVFNATGWTCSAASAVNAATETYYWFAWA